MAKFVKASDEIDKIVNDIANELNLINYGVNFEAFHVPNLKEAVQVVKANGYAEYFAGREDLVLILVREDAFDMVDEANKYLWIRMAMDTISFDTEKDKLILGCPMISVPVGFYETKGKVAVDSALLAQYTLASLKQKEEEEKAAKAAQKKAKKKQN